MRLVSYRSLAHSLKLLSTVALLRHILHALVFHSVFSMAAAARAHRALRTDDVLACVFSRLSLRDGCVSVASVCKQWRDAWRRLVKGLYRPFRLGLGRFDYGDHLTAHTSGIIVPSYNEEGFQVFNADGSDRGFIQAGFNTPTAVALDDEGVSWVVLHDDCALVHRPIEYATLELRGFASPELEFVDRRPIDVAISGDAVLVLSHRDFRYGEVTVLARDTSAVRYRFGSSATPGGVDEMRGAMGLAVDGDFCFVADTYNQSVVVFNWRDGTFVRRYGKAGDAPEFGDHDDGDNYWDVGDYGTYDDDRKSAEPGQFNEPYDVAVRKKFLYVSERGGRRIQILRLPDNLSSANPEVVQIIPSPGGVELAGLCLDRNRLWCIGPPNPRGTPAGDPGHASINIFALIV